MPILKLCSWNGCHKVLNENTTYCGRHQKKWEEKEKQRYKEYQAQRRKDIRQKKHQDFYNSSSWKRVSKSVIESFCYIDILEYYRTGNLVQGEAVHHIIELEEDWNSRFDIFNLIYLTEKNHRRVHVEYDKGKKEKDVMQKILFDLVQRFIKEFVE